MIKSKKALAKLILIMLMLLTLVFIYSRSMKPREESKKESDTVGGIIAEIIPPETKPGEFIQINLRKIAHFTEFALLGAEAALFVLLFSRKGISVALSLLAAPNVALLDEVIQIYSNRGPSMLDVLIDYSGFFASAVLFYTVGYIILLIHKNVNKSRRKQTEL